MEEEEEEEEEGLEEVEEEEELNHNDWEVRMLAKELKKRESISTDFPSELEGGDGLVRRRSHRKRSDTDTDGSVESTERDAFGRPRAASLDQHNQQRRPLFGLSLGRGNGSGAASHSGSSGGSGQGSRSRSGIFKALSFDRDKDRL
ncbi:AGAP003349-PB-like protein [Anopheles sinensis]|uniref:AGAP003349-PB-like protein n=1 Tax=Anopheles sinensis TaxID=74873 RepID=A0A084VVX4_ANOSI|nr:AGAP003349-PB-like protein [Anopheles sinensis]